VIASRYFDGGSGAWVRCAARTCWGVVPVNGGRPQIISYAMTPTA